MAATPGVGSGSPSRSADGRLGIVCDHNRANVEESRAGSQECASLIG
jgi:hypothetical protein